MLATAALTMSLSVGGTAGQSLNEQLLGTWILGRVDGFNQDEAESQRNERTVIPCCLLAA
jgi:hypothetical protein